MYLILGTVVSFKFYIHPFLWSGVSVHLKSLSLILNTTTFLLCSMILVIDVLLKIYDGVTQVLVARISFGILLLQCVIWLITQRIQTIEKYKRTNIFAFAFSMVLAVLCIIYPWWWQYIWPLCLIIELGSFTQTYHRFIKNSKNNSKSSKTW